MRRNYSKKAKVLCASLPQGYTVRAPGEVRVKEKAMETKLGNISEGRRGKDKGSGKRKVATAGEEHGLRLGWGQG